MKRLAWSILIAVPFSASATDVYRSVDENGRITFSDRPGDSTELITVNAVVDSFSASSRRESDEADSGQATSEAEMAAQSPEAAAQAAAERAQNCLVARERSEAYSVSRRLFRTLPDGEREYLSDAEIEEARACLLYTSPSPRDS